MSLAVLRRFAEFLESLPEDQVADLAEGRAQLSYIPWGATEPVPPKPRKAQAKKAPATKVEVSGMLRALESAESRDAGRELLEPLPVADLRAVATAAGMTGVGRTAKPDLVEQIVALTIGSRLSFAALREL
jgi:hypothetical protein